MEKNFPFPVPNSCLNPKCLVQVPPQKHGFYKRNAIDANFSGRILIRRYYCKYCGKTISYLPSFCLPYFQHIVEIILIALCYISDSNHSLRACLKLLKNLGAMATRVRKPKPTALKLLEGNPGLGYAIQIDRVREHYQQAKQDPAEKALFKQLRLNIWLKQQIK